MRSLIKLAGIGCVVAFLTGANALATTVDFETLITGQSVNGQAGWTVEDEWGFGPVAAGKPLPFDEEVIDDGSGNIVWRYSNGVGYSEYSFQPYSHVTNVPAGESGSALWNDRGPTHTSPLSPPNPGTPVGSVWFHAGFRFRSATGAAQSDLIFTVSPSAKQSNWRNSYLKLADDGANGFDVWFYETGTEADPWAPSLVEIASDLSYTDWHTIDIYIEFIDGVNADTTGNDCVTVLVNGSVAIQGTTWESYYRSGNFPNLNPADLPHRQAVDSLLFRSDASVPANTGGGLYFDDVVIDNEESPESCPSPPAIPATGALGLVATAAVLLGGLAYRRMRAR